MLRRLGIRAKVLAVLAVPMLVVLLAGAFISWETLRNLQTEQNVRHIVAAATSYVAVNDALNDERAISQSGAAADDVTAARAKTDQAVAAFVPKLDAVDVSSFSSAVTNGIDTVEREFTEDLPQMRTNVDNGQFRVVGTGYAQFVDAQLGLFDNLAQEVGNRDVATYISTYVAIGRTESSLVQERVDGATLLGQTNPSTAAGQSYNTLASQTEVYRESARSAVVDLAIPGVLLPSGDPTATFTRYRGLIGTGSQLAMSVIQPQAFLDQIATQRGSLSDISGRVLQAADETSAKAITSAEQRAVVTIGATVLAAVASFVLALVVARTIVIPLRRLTAAATDLREELPKLVEQVQVPGEGPQMSAPQIPVTSRDEVGRLAGAFNAVNATTFHVAQEQAALRGSIAEMFVNVARRDQVLLNRQLSFIDSLERTEEDPQALANLFRLDHLATRMRRNAESLLVLAGIDSGRRLRDALPLSDVVRTASSEIEQYDRVELDLQADPHMLGFNALPAAHLLAELLENATVFSEPETPVVVTTAVAGPFVEVRILDLGLGMSDAELASANEKIASTAASDALGAQRLGLFVVGRLAQRLSAEVTLRKNANGPTGTETVVRFPATLFQSTEASPLGVYSDAAAAAAPEAPEVSEVDLAALTDGVTEQGLPHRRAADAGSGALPVRGGARAAYDENSIMLPEVETSALPTDLAAAGSDWTPLVVAGQGSGLPSRQPSAPSDAAADAAGPADAERPAAPAAPAARASLFSGFRGLAGRGSVQPAADEAAAGRPAEPEFVVPGLAPDEDWAPAAAAAAEAWASVEPAPTEVWEPAEPATPDYWAPPAPTVAETWAAAEDTAEAWVPTESEAAPAEVSAEPPAADETSAAWPSWVSNAPSWGEQADEGYVPATFALETAGEAAPVFAPATAEPWIAPEPAEPAEAVAASSVDEADPTTSDRWAPPEVDLAQWTVPNQEAPAFEPQAGTFAGLSDWNPPQSPAPADTVPYAPFERSLDEARAWATGAIPVVPEPAGFPGTRAADGADVAAAPADEAEDFAEATAWGQWNADAEPWSADEVPQLEPDAAAPAADDVAPEPEALVDEPVAGVSDEPVLPVTPGWAPTAATESFSDLVHADEPEAPKRRRGWFGRRKQETAAASAPVPEVAAEPGPVERPAAAPVRSSAWAPAEGTVVPEPFPTRVPVSAAIPVVDETPVAEVPAVETSVAPEPAGAGTSWSPQASWNPPAAPALPESSAGRSVPSWAPPEWAPRPASSAEPEPVVVPSSSAAESTSAPRIGTLDDEVAAMLALRSDIQEQALSELSQLSAYRPQVMPGADRLTRRVPAAVPEAPEIVESNAERDPNDVRTRLASFQSGTARGRRDAGVDEETP